MAALTFYGSSVADSTLTSACATSTTTGGTETSKTSSNTFSSGNVYMEVTSKGLTTAGQTTLPTPTGNGWVMTPGATTLSATAWSASVTLSHTAVTNLSPILLRFYKLSGGVYTPLGNLSSTITASAKTTYTFASSVLSQVTFGASDRLYVDLWIHDSSGISGDVVTVYLSSSATTGVAGDMQITTGSTTLPSFVTPPDGYGLFEGINPTDSPTQALARLDEMAAAGFKLVMNASLIEGHASDMVAYINHAASVGMKVIVGLHFTQIWKTNTISTAFPLMYADSGNQGTDSGFTNYIINQVKGLAGTWGYYVGDEVAAADHTALKVHTDIIKTADATHPRILVESSDETNNFSSGTTPFWDCCDVGADDYYPLGDDGSYTTNGADTSPEQLSAGITAYCTAKSISPAVVLQAQSWQEYYPPSRCTTYPACAPFPSAAIMRANRDAVCTYGTPRCVLWYSFFDVYDSANTSLVTPAPSPQLAQWYNLQAAISGYTLYGSSVADSTLATACLMAPTSGGVETSKQTTITGTGATYAEITSQGSSVADVAAIPGTPTGKGWIFYPGAGTFAAGNWSASVTLQFVLHGSPNQTTLRFFRRSGGVYTLIGSIVATTATLAKTTYTFAPTSMAAITFGASDGLYMDLWWHDASSDPSGDDPTIYVSSSAGAGVANDMQISTSAFSSAAGALGGTMAAHVTLAGTLSVTGVGKIAGQTFTNGISNFIFGAHDHGEPGMSVPYPSSAQITLAKQLGGPPMLLRTFFNDSATDAQITARLNAISDCGGIPLICLQTPTNATFNTHVVTFVGSGCNLYEFGNEPDGTATPLSVAAYSAAWNAQIPVLRSINPSASFLGPATTKGGDAYRRTWLSNCASSGVKPDGVTTHDYPCTGVSTTSACLLLDNLGARVQAARKDVESVFPGQNIAVGLSEWNVDAHFPMEPYSQTEPFVSQFYQDVLQSLIAVNADLACVFSLFAGGSNYAMINTSTGAKTGFYTAFQHAVSALMNFSTFALVQSATGSVGATNAASVTVPTKATGTGHLLVAFVMVQGAHVTITPPGGWAQIDTTQGISGGTGSVAMFYRQNSASGVTSHVFSFSASCNASVAFEEWSGVATSNALDQEVAKQNAKSATALTGTTGTLANPGELAIFGLAVPATNVLTYSGITNGYREDTSANATSSQATRAEATLFYKTGTSSTATSSGATMSGTGASGNTTILAVFRAAGTGIALSGECDGIGTLSGTLALTGGTGIALSGECDGVGTLSGTLTAPPTIGGTYTVVIGGVLI